MFIITNQNEFDNLRATSYNRANRIDRLAVSFQFNVIARSVEREPTAVRGTRHREFFRIPRIKARYCARSSCAVLIKNIRAVSRANSESRVCGGKLAEALQKNADVEMFMRRSWEIFSACYDSRVCMCTRRLSKDVHMTRHGSTRARASRGGKKKRLYAKKKGKNSSTGLDETDDDFAQSISANKSQIVSRSMPPDTLKFYYVE